MILAIALIPWSMGSYPALAAVPDPSRVEFSDPINLTFSEWNLDHPSVAVPSAAAVSGSVRIAWYGRAPDSFVPRLTQVSSAYDPWRIENIGPQLNTSERGCCAPPQIASAGGRTVLVRTSEDGSLVVYTRGPNEPEFARGGTIPRYSGPFAVAALDEDRIYVSTASSNGHLLVYGSADGGYSFGAPLEVTLASNSIPNLSLLAGPQGQLGACWEDYRNNAAGASSPQANPDIFAATIDPLLLAPAVSRRVDDSGLTISGQYNPACAFLPNGSMFVAWEDGRTSIPGDRDLRGSLSDANMTTFGPSIRIDDAGVSAVSHQTNPTVATDPGGNIYVAFEDDRDYVQGQNAHAIYYARVQDNGSAISPMSNHRVRGASEASVDPRLVAGPDGALYLVWRGAENIPKLAIANSEATGGDRPPTCRWADAPLVSLEGGIANFIAIVTDPEGTGTIASVTGSLDGIPTPLQLRLPYVDATINASSLSPGSHNLTATAEDLAGLESDCSLEIVINASVAVNRAPTLVITFPKDGFLAAVDFLVEGVADDPDGEPVRVFSSVDGSPWTEVGTEPNWSLSIGVDSVTFGSHMFSAFASDGNLTSALSTLAFVRISPLPRSPPSCIIDFPPALSFIAGNVSVYGRIMDPDGQDDLLSAEWLVQPVVGGGPLEIHDRFTLNFAVPDRATFMAVNVTVVDKEGLKADCGSEFRVSPNSNSTPPSITINRPSNFEPVSGPTTVGGTADPGSEPLKAVWLGLPGLGFLKANGTTAWVYNWTIEGVPAGRQDIIAIAESVAGVLSPPAIITVIVLPSGASNGSTKWLLAVLSANVSAPTVEAGASVGITVSITNYGNLVAGNVSLLITASPAQPAGGATSRLVLVFLNITAGGSPVEYAFTWIPSETGRFTITAVLNEDRAYPDSAIVQPDATTSIEVLPRSEIPAGLSADALFLVLVMLVAAAGLLYYLGRRRNRRP